MTSVKVRIICELTDVGGKLVDSYDVGHGNLDLTGMTSSIEAMKQLPGVLREIADQLSAGFAGEL